MHPDIAASARTGAAFVAAAWASASTVAANAYFNLGSPSEQASAVQAPSVAS